MRLFSCVFILLCLVSTSCSPTVSKLISDCKAGEAVIRHADGKFSSPMPVKDAFAQLKSNEKMFFGQGRAELFEPLEISNLENIQLIGNKTQLVAKLDMPVITFNDVSRVGMEDLLIVHEIGEWCAQNCVEFYKASDLSIDNCKFDGSGYFGLALTKVSNAIITNSKFYNCEYGFASWGSENIRLKGNEFSKNRGEDIQSGSEDEISNDYIKENTFLKD